MVGSLWKTLEAAARLANENIDAEVIDLRTLRPLDDATIMASVQKTRRAVIVDEGWRSGSLAAEIEQAFWELDGHSIFIDCRTGLLACSSCGDEAKAEA